MQSNIQHASGGAGRRSRANGFLLTAALALTAGFGFPETSSAAEIRLSGSGSFKPLSAEQLAGLPADLSFSRDDLSSGSWSISVLYEDSVPDADPDPYVARYAGAIRAFRLVVGSTAVDLPVDQAAILVSDGGGGFPHRESIRLEAKASTSSGLLRLGWVQVNQQAKGADVRGQTGLLPSDAMPAYSVVSKLATASAFDRFLELRIDGAGGESRPLLYLSSSDFLVKAQPATVP